MRQFLETKISMDMFCVPSTLLIWTFLFVGHTMGAVTTKTDCGCNGDDPAIDAVVANCTSEAGRVLIQSVYRGVKPSNSGCPISATTITRDESTCCTYVQNTDCQIPVNYYDVSSVYTNCVGKTSCSVPVTSQSILGNCSGNNLLSDTNYMCIEYICVDSASELPMCDTSGTELALTTTYFHDDSHPTGITQSGCCACTLSPSANSATVDIVMIDVSLHDEAATCLQTILVEQSGSLLTYNCSINNHYEQTTFFTANDSVTLYLKNDPAALGSGRVWFKGEVSNGAMTMSCGTVTLCPDETTIAPVVTLPGGGTVGAGGATTTTTAVPTTTTEETWLFGQSVTISAILIAGLFLIVTLLFIIVCLVCYHKGKKAAVDDAQLVLTPGSLAYSPPATKSRKSRRHNHSPPFSRSTNSPPPYSREPVSPTNVSVASYNTSPSSTSSEYGAPSMNFERDVGMPTRRGAMFVYRPHEGRSHLRSYQRRSSLTRIDTP